MTNGLDTALSGVYDALEAARERLNTLSDALEKKREEANNKLELLDAIIDDRCSFYGVLDTINWLRGFGLDEHDLIDMHFDPENVKEVFESEL